MLNVSLAQQAGNSRVYSFCLIALEIHKQIKGYVSWNKPRSWKANIYISALSFELMIINPYWGVCLFLCCVVLFLPS